MTAKTIEQQAMPGLVPDPTINEINRRIELQRGLEDAHYAQLRNYLDNHNHLLVQIVETLKLVPPQSAIIEAANYAQLKNYLDNHDSLLRQITEALNGLAPQFANAEAAHYSQLKNHLENHDQLLVQIIKTLKLVPPQSAIIEEANYSQLKNYLDNHDRLLRQIIDGLKKIPTQFAQMETGHYAQLTNHLENHNLLLIQILQRLNADTVAGERPDGRTANRLPTVLDVHRRIGQQIETGTAQYAQLENYLSNQNHLQIQIIETVNQLLPQGAMVVGVLGARVTSLEAQLGNINERLTAIMAKVAEPPPDTSAGDLRRLAFAAMLERARARQSDARKAASKGAYRPAQPETFERYLEKLQELEPQAFPQWVALMRAGEEAYVTDPRSSCAVWGNVHAEAFRDFCSLFLTGRVLDIGLGPVGRPIYLQGYPSELISAIEPLPMLAEVDFEVVRGFSEFLPWPDGSFQSVIASTSLDHVLSLDRSLAEIRRVLTPDGRFLVWIGSIPGSAKYDPSDPGLQPIDGYHLFHIDQDWFEPMIAPMFQIEERLVYPAGSFANVFYCLAPR